jgi:hypothetical protein
VDLSEHLQVYFANHSHFVFSLRREAKAANLRLLFRRAASLLGGDHVAKSLEILSSSWLRRFATDQSLDCGIGDIYSEV